MEEVAAMTAVNCPMCELRFASKNERDWHLNNEHHPVHVQAPVSRPVAWKRPVTSARPDNTVEPAEAE